MDDHITTEEFVSILRKRYWEEVDVAEVLDKSFQEGWVDATDIYYAVKPLERRMATKIIHQFLRQILQEKDTDDWTQAKRLKDLYDCRTCVNHVAQVYCKGIMAGCKTEDGSVIFGMTAHVTVEEAENILERILQPKLRLCAEKAEEKESAAKVVSRQQAERLMEEYKRLKKTYLLIDVRPLQEYEKVHMTNAVSIPFAKILEKPGCVGQEKEICIFSYCEKGYQSEIAANCLVDAGYETVYYFAWDAEDKL